MLNLVIYFYDKVVLDMGEWENPNTDKFQAMVQRNMFFDFKINEIRISGAR